VVIAPSPATPLATTYVTFLLLFAAEALIALIGLLYSFTLRGPAGP
jgi:hypothetical protein